MWLALACLFRFVCFVVPAVAYNLDVYSSHNWCVITCPFRERRYIVTWLVSKSML